MYCIWVWICYGINGQWLYPQLNPEVQNWQDIVTTISTMMSMTIAMFLIVLLLHELRDRSTRKAKCDREPFRPI
jgi:hypothetical protein